jgi:hypothetical protein
MRYVLAVMMAASGLFLTTRTAADWIAREKIRAGWIYAGRDPHARARLHPTLIAVSALGCPARCQGKPRPSINCRLSHV